MSYKLSKIVIKKWELIFRIRRSKSLERKKN